jgi:hypothetical protein
VAARSFPSVGLDLHVDMKPYRGVMSTTFLPVLVALFGAAA